jgi:hypothetical protein
VHYFLLGLPVRDISNPHCTAHYNIPGVEIVFILIHRPSVMWFLRSFNAIARCCCQIPWCKILLCRRSNISKKYSRPGGMTPSEWTRSVRGVRDTPVAAYSAPSTNTTLLVAYRPPIAVSPFPLALSVSNFKRTLWR